MKATPLHRSPKNCDCMAPLIPLLRLRCRRRTFSRNKSSTLQRLPRPRSAIMRRFRQLRYLVAHAESPMRQWVALTAEDFRPRAFAHTFRGSAAHTFPSNPLKYRTGASGAAHTRDKPLGAAQARPLRGGRLGAAVGLERAGAARGGAGRAGRGPARRLDDGPRPRRRPSRRPLPRPRLRRRELRHRRLGVPPEQGMAAAEGSGHARFPARPSAGRGATARPQRGHASMATAATSRSVSGPAPALCISARLWATAQ